MFGEGNPHRIVVLDCGIKHNMIRNLVKVCLHLSRYVYTCQVCLHLSGMSTHVRYVYTCQICLHLSGMSTPVSKFKSNNVSPNVQLPIGILLG